MHSIRTHLIVAIELAKCYYSHDEIARIIADELAQLLTRPSAVVIPFATRLSPPGLDGT